MLEFELFRNGIKPKIHGFGYRNDQLLTHYWPIIGTFWPNMSCFGPNLIPNRVQKWSQIGPNRAQHGQILARITRGPLMKSWYRVVGGGVPVPGAGTPVPITRVPPGPVHHPAWLLASGAARPGVQQWFTRLLSDRRSWTLRTVRTPLLTPLFRTLTKLLNRHCVLLHDGHINCHFC